MRLEGLEQAVRNHRGELLCERIHESSITKRVRFFHRVEPPQPVQVPDVGRLRDFYETFGSVLFYYDEKSQEAGKFLASPDRWPELDEAFRSWFDHLSEEERQAYLPNWVDTCLVIGETPMSGNYLLMPTEGPHTGQVFEFDHDGFEFYHMAADIVAYTELLIQPNESVLADISSHMRFVEDDPLLQWYILELQDNQGRVIQNPKAT